METAAYPCSSTIVNREMRPRKLPLDTKQTLPLQLGGVTNAQTLKVLVHYYTPGDIACRPETPLAQVFSYMH